MTKIKEAEVLITINGKVENKKTTYYEVGIDEVEKMFEKVALGEDEEKLREELIKNSTW